VKKGPLVNEAFVDYGALPFEHTSFGAANEVTVTPKCWKTIYHLLDLYATMPETKTIAHR
jgi:hypothetical protein